MLVEDDYVFGLSKQILVESLDAPSDTYRADVAFPAQMENRVELRRSSRRMGPSVQVRFFDDQHHVRIFAVKLATDVFEIFNAGGPRLDQQQFSGLKLQTSTAGYARVRKVIVIVVLVVIDDHRHDR